MTKASFSYSRYSYTMLAVLLASYVLNSLDRSIMGILLEPIGKEFGLRDWQLGLLSGLAFALMYSTLALPIASWADRYNRRNILALAILIWSLGTVFSGLASSFLLLLLARMLTATGEAGCNPSAHSLISDQFSTQHRATALGIFALGAPAGASLAGLLGGYGMDFLGWRNTLLWAGAPGLILALIVFVTLREPRTAIIAANETASIPPFATVARTLLRQRSFRQICIASALHSAAIYGAASFNASYLMRTHSWSGSSVGKLFACMGVAGIIGTFVGGYVSDRLNLRQNEQRWHLWVPGLASLLVIPLQCVSYLSSNAQLMFITFCSGAFLSSIFFGPTFASVQALAAPRHRAVAAALLLFAKALLGMGLGPLLVGIVSDLIQPTISSPLRYAMLLIPLFNIASAIVFIAAAKYYASDLSSAATATATAKPIAQSSSPPT